MDGDNTTSINNHGGVRSLSVPSSDMNELRSTPSKSSTLKNDEKSLINDDDIDPLDVKLISNNNNFDFDVSLDTLCYTNDSPGENMVGEDHDTTPRKSVQLMPEDIKKAGDLAGVFLHSKKNFLNDNNILDSELTKVENHSHSTNNVTKTSLSRSTLVRAERVKTSIGLKYMMIERIYQSSLDPKFPGVDGVYNPLQIIRNRKIRSKYHEHPKPLSVKTLPLASNVFSKKVLPRDGKKQWKSIWSVELNEFISDQSWRAGHIYELKNAKGEFWFQRPATTPEQLDANGKTKDYKHSSTKRRLHDKLFNDDSDIGSVNTSMTDKKAKSRMLPLNESKLGKRDRFKQRMKKSLRYSTTSSNSSFEEARNNSYLPKVTGETADDSKPEISEIENDEELLNSISIKPVDNKRDVDNLENVTPTNEDEVTDEKDKIIDETSSSPIITLDQNNGNYNTEKELIEQQLLQINSELNYLRNCTTVKYRYLTDIHPKLEESMTNRLNYLLYNQIPNLNRIMININDDSIPAYELHCTTLLNEIKSLMHIISDDYSIRIDNLLTATDRLSGEISTSMTLELRKIDEQLDRLNDSLFGNLVTDAIKSNKDKLSMNSDGYHRILYLVLENFIVILLRLTWVIVNIYNCCLYILKLIWRIIRTLFF